MQALLYCNLCDNFPVFSMTSKVFLWLKRTLQVTLLDLFLLPLLFLSFSLCWALMEISNLLFYFINDILLVKESYISME